MISKREVGLTLFWIGFAYMVGMARLKATAFETSIPGIGPIRGFRDPTPGTPIRMLGRTSGLVTGEIMSCTTNSPIANRISKQARGRLVFTPQVHMMVSSRLKSMGDFGPSSRMV